MQNLLEKQRSWKGATKMRVENRQSPWTTIGTEIHGLSYGDAMEEAGIAYEVNNIPLNVRIPIGSGPMGDSLTVGVEGKRLNYRTDSLDPLGIVGDRYQVTQMRELGTIVESLVGEGWEPLSAGSLRGGAQAFIVGRLPFESQTGDFVANLGIVNSFDGSTALRFVNTPMRPTCCNAIGLMLRSAKASFSIRHTANVMDRMEDARSALNMAMAYNKKLDEEIEYLLGLELPDPASVQPIIDKLVPAPRAALDGSFIDEKGKPMTERSARSRQNKRQGIMSNWLTSTTITDVRYTGWGFLNAVSEWEQWQRPAKSSDYRAERTLRKQLNPGESMASIAHSELSVVAV